MSVFETLLSKLSERSTSIWDDVNAIDKKKLLLKQISEIDVANLKNELLKVAFMLKSSEDFNLEINDLIIEKLKEICLKK
ncbi:MAG: hypothetical protein QW228_01370 [Candidatus Aenigmatarchaeota archaeon]